MFSVVFAALFIYLGLWQVDRYHEKNRMLEAARERRNQPGVTLSELPEDPARLDGSPVALEGRYDAGQVFLLDNRVLQGRVGFEVLVPFVIAGSDTNVLVNRGFVPMGRTRRQTPDILPLAEGHRQLRGHVYVREENVVMNQAANLVEEPPWPIIVQVADPVLLQLELDRSLYPHVIRLAPDDPNALPRDWPVTTILPQRHWGYALQWFAMAIAVVIAWLAFSVKRGNDDRDQ